MAPNTRASTNTVGNEEDIVERDDEGSGRSGRSYVSTV